MTSGNEYAGAAMFGFVATARGVPQAELLTVEVDQEPAGGSAVLRMANSRNHDPDGIEAVQALVAAAPAMRPCVVDALYSRVEARPAGSRPCR